VSKLCPEPKAKKPKRKAEGGSEATAAKPAKRAKPCYAFQRGECQRGDDCMFIHATASAPESAPKHVKLPKDEALASKPQTKSVKKARLPKPAAHPFEMDDV
jgi:hypothetical protein